MARQKLRSIAVAVLGLCAGGMLVEIVFQFIEATPLWRVLPVSEASFYGPDPFTGYRHRAGARGIFTQENRVSIAISKLGLRDRERPFEHGNAPRAVVVGDSIIEALQVSDDQTAVATAERLVASDRRNVEVINLGLAGATPAVDIARLQSVGLSLKPDLAIVVVSIRDFIDQAIGNDSGWPAYRRNPDGQLSLAYGFRNSRGYHFRTSARGQVVYWLLDHSALFRLLNARMNVGLFAEWPRGQQEDKGPENGSVCENKLNALTALWQDGTPQSAREHLEAFLRDLSDMRREHHLPIVLAFRGIPAPCEAQSVRRLALVKTIGERLVKSGLQLADMEMLTVEKAGTSYFDRLHGFGALLGRGHLNDQGNRVYGEILADLVNKNMLPH